MLQRKDSLKKMLGVVTWQRLQGKQAGLGADCRLEKDQTSFIVVRGKGENSVRYVVKFNLRLLQNLPNPDQDYTNTERWKTDQEQNDDNTSMDGG